MKRSSIKDLSIEELIEKALSEPIENIADLCSKDSELLQVCDNETFWEKRIEKDFPSYASSPLSSLTYHEYYTMLWKSWNLRDKEGKFVFQDIPDTFGEQLNLIYPVPRYDTDENGVLQGDIAIFRVPDENIFFVGMSNRKTVIGASLPSLDLDILQPVDKLILGKKSYIQLYLDKNYRADRDGSFFIPLGGYRRFVKAAAEVGYLAVTPGVSVDPNNKLVIANRVQMRTVEKKPSPKLEKASPPVRRRKLNKMFKFLSSNP